MCVRLCANMWVDIFVRFCFQSAFFPSTAAPTNWINQKKERKKSNEHGQSSIQYDRNRTYCTAEIEKKQTENLYIKLFECEENEVDCFSIVSSSIKRCIVCLCVCLYHQWKIKVQTKSKLCHENTKFRFFYFDWLWIDFDTELHWSAILSVISWRIHTSFVSHTLMPLRLHESLSSPGYNTRQHCSSDQWNVYASCLFASHSSKKISMGEEKDKRVLAHVQSNTNRILMFTCDYLDKEYI